MFIFGQNELLERLQGQINQQLQGNQSSTFANLYVKSITKDYTV